MACVFPGADSPEQLWRNVLAGRRQFRRLPAERLPRGDYYDPDPSAPLRTYSDQMAVITGWRFDPIEFRIPPITVDASDVTHWLALHTARAALRDAGLDLARADRSRIGVVLGNSLGGEFTRSRTMKLRWPTIERSIRAALAHNGINGRNADGLVETIDHFCNAELGDINEDTLAGHMSNTIAGRIAGYFDLGGGAYTMDGACSSSLLALANACNQLMGRELDCAIAGGVDVSLDPFEMVGFAKTKALAKDDIRPYHEHAEGMLPGEGCGMFVLMREREARRRQLPVRAVIRGWGVSSDGAGGITAPRVEGQQRALRQAYDRAGYSVGDVQLIEGHGTGTPLGDQVEITAIRALLDEAPGAAPVWIGSIKSSIGHCKAAAGSAGLVKAVMALQRRIIPPSSNCERPNPLFGRPWSRLRPAMRGREWRGDGPRRASVSAMGFGGANSHVTLEEAEPGTDVRPEDLALLGSTQATELVLLCATDETALIERVRSIADVAERISRAELTDLAAALAQRTARELAAGHAGIRCAVIARSPWQLADALRDVAGQIQSGAALEDVRHAGVEAGRMNDDDNSPPHLVALYPGQGAQRLGMGSHLLRRFPTARQLYDDVDTATHALLDRSLRTYAEFDKWTADDATLQRWNDELTDTRVAQPAIAAHSLAVLRVLRSLGLEPDIHIGHSLGEITALCAAGVFDEADAVRVAALRGRAMGDLRLADPGAMLAIAASPADVETLIENLQGLAVSNYNSPRQTVVAGATGAVRDLEHRCARARLRSRRVNVSHAFHSDIVAPAANRFAADLARVAFESPRGTVISSATGDVLPYESDLRALLSEHVRRPVRFTDAVRRAARYEPALWIEVGPGGILTSLVHDILGASVPCMTTDTDDVDGFDLLNGVCAAAFVRGFPLHPEQLFAHRCVEPFDLDSYDPQLIVNPCERPVTPPTRRHAIEITSGLIPDGEMGITSALTVGDETAPSGADDSARDGSAGALNLENEAIEWIAMRTGFPVAAISPEMRIRDDLNLDSIKLGELWITMAQRARVEVAGDPAALANASIAELVGALRSAAGGNEDPQRAAISPGRESGVSWVATFGTGEVDAPLEQENVFVHRRIALCAPGSDPAELSVALVAAGLSVLVPDIGQLENGSAPADVSAVIIALPAEERSFLSCDVSTFEERVRVSMDALYHTLRWATRGRASPVTCIVLRPVDAADHSRDMDGGAGMIRTFFLENSGSVARWIRMPCEFDGHQVAEIVLRELGAADGSGCFSYDTGGRRTAQVAVPLRGGTPGRLRLDGSDVAFVTGGAKGITAELALALARETGVRLALAGSSVPPGRDADPEVNEIARNLRRFRDAGITCMYVQCDVTDSASVAQAVRAAEAALGRITVLMHGAGITRFTALRDKSYAEYRQCMEVKVHGLYNLLRSLPPERLKAIHVLSSVLGRTGMRSQADYAAANAWLDEAVQPLASCHPELHALSLCYSVWEGAGLGDRLGALEFLRTVGVTPIGVEKGVAAYMQLVREAHAGSSFVITGRLSTDLETQLYGARPQLPGRYMERVRQWVPETELVADATLSFVADPYLAHHVFDGTPLLPGVLALEAMAQAACALLGTDELPVFSDVRFERPLIVTSARDVIMRVIAVRVDDDRGVERGDGVTDADNGEHVRVRIRADTDGFHTDHFSASCVFGSTATAEQMLPPSTAAPLDVDVSMFVPAPLFQGEFFRHIERIERLDDEEGITTIRIPAGAGYFGDTHERALRTGSPAARDSFLQTGALLLPNGTLPRGIERLEVHRLPGAGEVVTCQVTVEASDADQGTHRASYRVYDGRGNMIESATGLVLETPRSKASARAALPIDDAAADLRTEMKHVPHSLAVVRQNTAERTPRTPMTVRRVRSPSPARRAESRGNALAVEQAMGALLPRPLSASALRLDNDESGRPRLLHGADSEWSEGLDLSLADCRGYSIALVAPGRVGVDLELVEARDRDLWRALLRPAGEALARALAARRNESYDLAATRVWTLYEALKKAEVPDAAIRVAGDSEHWLVLEARTGSTITALWSAAVRLEDGAMAVLSLAHRAADGIYPAAERSAGVALGSPVRDAESLQA